MKFPESIKINGKEYNLVKERREAPMAVYKFDKTYLRIGDKEDIEAELKMRDQLKEHGFPVPQRFRQGQTDDGMFYYTEKAIGVENFSEIFIKDLEKQGSIDQKSFIQFIDISKEFAAAQLNTINEKADIKEFINAVNLKDIYKEFSREKDKIEKFVEEAKERLSIFPLVLTHGDFNSHNLYRQGVIDFENLFYAPAGYDIVTNIFNPEFFPILGDYEVVNPFRFTQEQKQEYFKVFDEFYLEKGIPRISDYEKYFSFFRATWLTANKEHIPKVQQFRKELYKKYFLEDEKDKKSPTTAK